MAKFKIKPNRLIFLTLLLALAGTTGGTLGDICHVLTQTTGYPQDQWPLYFWKLPFWVPFLFAGAGITVGWLHVLTDPYLGASWKRRGTQDFNTMLMGVYPGVFFYCLSGYLPFGQPGLNDLILAGGFFAVWYRFDRTWQGLFQATLTAVCGCAFEINLIQKGVFYYTPGHDHLFGVASWLPWLYARMNDFNSRNKKEGLEADPKDEAEIDPALKKYLEDKQKNPES